MEKWDRWGKEISHQASRGCGCPEPKGFAHGLTPEEGPCKEGPVLDEVLAGGRLLTWHCGRALWEGLGIVGEQWIRPGE